jgi:predicted unusual protein kinase regulating ubiquinone biosynthesis (AarF/ABC1/UbiB family)
LALLPLRFTRDWDAMREQLDDVAVTCARETDYEEEASFQEEAREALADLPGVIVPRVHRDVSTKRVLVTDLLEGVHLADYVARHPSQEDRALRGTQVMEATFRLYYGARFCYADPHPGNYLFLPDGRTGLLDFGCCRRFDEADWRVLALSEEAYRRGDEAWEKAVRASVGTDRLPRDRDQALRAVADWMWEPLRHAGPYDFGAGDYFARGVAALRDLVRRRATRAVPVFSWVHRSLVGVRAIACRLRAKVDMRALHERESAGVFA